MAIYGFKTKNSEYHVNFANKIVQGGKLKSPLYFVDCQIIVGNKARFLLPDGRIWETSIVKEYLSV